MRATDGGAKEWKGLPRPRQAAHPQGCGLRHSSAKMERRICSWTPLFLQVEVMATISVGIDLAKNVLAREPPDRRKSLMSLMGYFLAGLDAFRFFAGTGHQVPNRQFGAAWAFYPI